MIDLGIIRRDFKIIMIYAKDSNGKKIGGIQEQTGNVSKEIESK